MSGHSAADWPGLPEAVEHNYSRRFVCMYKSSPDGFHLEKLVHEQGCGKIRGPWSEVCKDSEVDQTNRQPVAGLLSAIKSRTKSGPLTSVPSHPRSWDGPWATALEECGGPS